MLKMMRWLLPVILTYLVFQQCPALAQENLVISVSPVRFELDAEKGQTLAQEITLSNASSHRVVLEASAQDFVAEGSDGKPSFVPASQSAWSMSAWVSTDPPRITLEPGEKKKVNVLIQVPDDAEPGGHYAAVLFSNVPSGEGATAIVAKVGTLILLTVGGDITEAGHASLLAPRMTEGGPIDFTLIFNNEGNVHTKPVGSITITGLSGKVAATLQTGGENVLAKSSRTFTTRWTDVPYGLFRAKASLQFGQDKTTVTPGLILFVLPYKSILAGLAMFIAGAGVSVLLNRGKRSKDRGAAQ